MHNTAIGNFYKIVIRQPLFYLPLVLSVTLGCSAAGNKPATTAGITPASNQFVEITVDGKKMQVSDESVISFTFIMDHLLGVAIMSEGNDFQFAITSWMAELKPGTYQVFDCKGPSECDQEAESHGELAMYAPYPKDPPRPFSETRIAYRSAPLGLSPLSLVITEVKDEQQAGNPWRTKRVVGTFKGTMAYVEKDDAWQWHVIGNTTRVEGKFSVFCSIR